MTARGQGIVLLTLAFGLGALAGAAGLVVYQWRWGEPPRGAGPRGVQVMLRQLDDELRLTPDQHGRVEAILRETGEEFARVREEVRPRFREIRLRSRGRIRELLDAGQQQRFDALASRWEELFRRRRPPGDARGG
jgi:hypothetical protein